MFPLSALPGIVLIFIVALLLLSGVRILQEYERGVVFRLGSALEKVKGPGLVLIIPFGIDRLVKVGMRVMTMDVPVPRTSSRATTCRSR